MDDKFGTIILAAGSSSRMGQSKQQLNIDGEPLLLRSVKAALDSTVKKIIVVLGASEKENRALIDNLPVDIIYNPRWESGMGSSLKTGLTSFIKTTAGLEGIITLVCDQPLLKSGHIDKLIEKHRLTEKPVVASWYAQTLGVPAFFGKVYFQKLLSLDDDQGAKKLLQQHPEDVGIVNFPEGEIDLDTPEDYQAFQQSNHLK